MNTEYEYILEKNMHHFHELQSIVAKHGFPYGGGSYMMDGKSLAYNKTSLKKQELLFHEVKNLEPDFSILEIGVYAGHSMLIMLLARTSGLICGVDPCHPFTEECVDYLNEEFAGIMFEKGTSRDILPTFPSGAFDLVHIDGCHDIEEVLNDIDEARRLLTLSGRCVIDDWDGVEPQLPKSYKDNMEVLWVADCPNPNAVVIFH